MAPSGELRPDGYRVSHVFFPEPEDPTLLLLVLVERPPVDPADTQVVGGGLNPNVERKVILFVAMMGLGSKAEDKP